MISMGDGADALIEQGLDALGLHRAGHCEIGCEQCYRQERTMAKEEYVNVGSGEVKAATQKAALISFDHGEEWLPFSQMSQATIDQCERGTSIDRVIITPWMAEQKGLEPEIGLDEDIRNG